MHASASLEGHYQIFSIPVSISLLIVPVASVWLYWASLLNRHALWHEFEQQILIINIGDFLTKLERHDLIPRGDFFGKTLINLRRLSDN